MLNCNRYFREKLFFAHCIGPRYLRWLTTNCNIRVTARLLFCVTNNSQLSLLFELPQLPKTQVKFSYSTSLSDWPWKNSTIKLRKERETELRYSSKSLPSAEFSARCQQFLWNKVDSCPIGNDFRGVQWNYPYYRKIIEGISASLSSYV